MEDKLTTQEQEMLLHLARQALACALCAEQLPQVELQSLPEKLQQPGATFVTLTRGGQLRGCIGALEAHQPLVFDVIEHAIAAALQDYRFPQVTADELSEIEIEISRLTPARPLDYDNPEDLLAKLAQSRVGVVLRDGLRRATFLPQVWEKIPDPAEFMDHLCYKMGTPIDLWRRRKLDVLVYQVEEFHEHTGSKAG
jgi:AmmeMemoRadiSam system protein A